MEGKIVTTVFSLFIWFAKLSNFCPGVEGGEVAIILGQNSFLYSLHTTQYFSWFFKHVVAALQTQTSRRGSLEKTLRVCHGHIPFQELNATLCPKVGTQPIALCQGKK